MTERFDTARAALRALVPAWYKTMDAEHPAAVDDRGPLLALLDILADQGAIVEEDIARLYDDWFIETCSDWAVPYIGALVRAGSLPSAAPELQRRVTANILGYRRRKGTVGVVEQLARDVTGWPALASESFRGLAQTQSLAHVRPGRGGFAEVRNATRASAAGSPFDAFAHTLDVRRPGVRGSRWSIPAIGLFLWRQRAAALEQVEAAPDPAAPWLFHADPERRARPWFNRAAADSDVDQRAHEADLPVALRRRAVADALRARRLAATANVTPPADYFGNGLNNDDAQPAFLVEVQDVANGIWRKVAPEKIRMVHLAGAPATIAQPAKPIPAREGGGGAFADAELLIDPALGRIAIPAGIAIPAALRTSHFEGIGAAIGAGSFDRNDDLAAMIATIGGSENAAITWQASVMKGRTTVPVDNLFATLEEAVDAWNGLGAGPRLGLILIEDDARHDLGAGVAVQMGAANGLIIAAGRWHADLSRPMAERLGHYEADASRPHLTGDLMIKAQGASRLGVSGLFQTGKFWIKPGMLERFEARQCSFDANTPLVAATNTELAMAFTRCLSGAMAIDPLIPEVTVASTIVHGPLAAKGARLTIESATVIGPTDVRELWASNTLFAAPVKASRTQRGCTRFCYVPDNSRAPRRFRCQPKLAVDAGAPSARVKPHFVSLDRASPWYAQLHPLAHPALRKGGDDGGEIGAYRAPSSVLMEANVGATLDEYIRLGMTAGLLMAT